MAKIEVEESEVRALNQARQLFDALLQDKDIGLSLKRKVREKIPTAKFNDLEIVETVTKPYDEKITKLSEENKKLEERLNKWEQDKLEASEEAELDKTLTSVKDKFKFTDEGMKKVIARMTEKKNPDAESAAAWVLSQEPKNEPVKPSSMFGGKADLFGSAKKSDEWAALNEDPIAYADQEIMNIMNNPENYREFGGAL
jgi:hypothetical protein